MNTTTVLSENVRAEIDKWIQKYPPDQKQSAVLTALHLAQQQNGGWLNETMMDAVADYLDMPHIAVYEVASFYSMYELKPVGRHKICICTSISCHLKGSQDIITYLEEKLGIKPGETTSDGKFTLKKVECLAACTKAPMFQIGQQYYENLTPAKVDEILANLE